MTIGASPFTVGRLPTNTLCLPAPSVSKMHAELVTRGNDLIVRDLGSTNGTFVNQRRVADTVLLQPGDLIHFATEVFRVQCEQSVTASQTINDVSFGMVQALVEFDTLMSTRAVVPHFQPIVTLADHHIIGYEALGRSPLASLANPAAMFSAAAHLGQEASLSALLRDEAVRVGRQLPAGVLFLNTHAKEVGTPELLTSLAEIRRHDPERPLALEIHEAAIVDERAMYSLRNTLRELHVRLAYDDFGAGQARLDELTRFRPDYVKFDMKLVRDLHQAPPERRQMVARLVDIVRELGIVPLAEGIECEEESLACYELGFQLGQGFHFGRPAPVQSYRR